MKKLVVTGATKGIGRAIAEKYLSKGYQVAVCARNPQELEQMQINADASYGKERLFTFTCDVSLKEQLKNFYDFVQKNMGTIDILVNNAGLFEPGKISEEADGVLERQMATNLYSAYHLSRLFIPDMITNKNGHIFNICSIASIMAYDNGGSYTISKFALYGMTKVLRQELIPHHIKVTAVLPGATLSASWAGTDLPEERFMKVEDVADSVYSISQLSQSAVVEEILLRPILGDI